MSEIVKINPTEFGIEKNKAVEIYGNLPQLKKERDTLENQFNEVIRLDIESPGTWTRARELRLLIQKNRTQGINVWHKTSKDFFLKGGQFVDAIKRVEISVNERMETALEEIEKYEQIKESERLKLLQSERMLQLTKYVDEDFAADLSGMENDVWDAYFNTKKNIYDNRIAAEKKAEEERIEAEKKEAARIKQLAIDNARLQKEAEQKEAQQLKEEKERQRLAEIEANKLEKERAEQDRIRIENEAKAKAELEKVEAEKQRLIAIEKAKADKLEKKLQAQKEAEIKAENDRLAQLEAKANQGDAANVKDLVNDLTALKTKYTFKSKKNQKMYSDVGMLIEKVINHINK